MKALTFVGLGTGDGYKTAQSARPGALKELLHEADAAEVMDNTSKPVEVCLLAQGCLDKPVPCSSIQTLKNLPPGTPIWGTVSQQQNDGTVTMVCLIDLRRAE